MNVHVTVQKSRGRYGKEIWAYVVHRDGWWPFVSHYRYGSEATATKAGLRDAIELTTHLIEEEGYTVEFVEWCEDGETPGLIGMKAGVTIPSKRKVKIKTHDVTPEQTLAVLNHELEHVLGADKGEDHPDLGLRCGGRVNGFGDPV